MQGGNKICTSKFVLVSLCLWVILVCALGIQMEGHACELLKEEVGLEFDSVQKIRICVFATMLSSSYLSHTTNISKLDVNWPPTTAINRGVPQIVRKFMAKMPCWEDMDHPPPLGLMRITDI